MMNLNPPKYFADRVDQFLYPKIDAQKEFMASIKKNPPPYDSSRNGGRGRVAVRFPSVLSGSLSHTLDLDAPLRIAAQRKLTRYRQQYADNKNRYTRCLGWRMHCGAEVTESSTNKQHHLLLQTICTITMTVRGEPMPMKLMKQNKGWRPLGRLFAS